MTKVRFNFAGVGGPINPDWVKVMTPNNSGVWENIEIADDDYDIEVHFGKPYNGYDKDKSIYIPREPHVFEPYTEQSDKDFVYVHREWFATRWWIGQTFDQLIAMEPPTKSQFASAIVSSKGWLPGHKIRHEQIPHWKEKGVHVYGSAAGADYPVLALNEAGRKDKSPGLLDYEWNIAIENCVQNDYVTEKVDDALLCWTAPIYWGTGDIKMRYPSEPYLWLHEIDLDDLPPYEDMVEKIREARQLILYKYQLWPTVKYAIDNIA